VESAIEKVFGSTILLLRPTPKRLAGWRAKAQTLAARNAGYAYAAYGQLKLSTVVEEIADSLFRLGGESGSRHGVRRAVWAVVRAQGLNAPGAMSAAGATAEVVLFLRNFDLAFRVRRLRFLARRIGEVAAHDGAPVAQVEEAREAVYTLLGRYLAVAESKAERFPAVEDDAGEAMTALTALLGLKQIDDEADALLTSVLAAFPKAARRSLILSYLGFPFYDIATLPLLQGEGLDEFDPVKVDRISPDDCSAIRTGGAAATLKGIQFNSFGAFFSRAYRENDYLWGRLHGAERLIDIVASTLLPEQPLAPETVAELKRAAFRAILVEERPRLTRIAGLFEELEREVG
jgi:hypothetical protein